jgi:hypothetical protein
MNQPLAACCTLCVTVIVGNVWAQPAQPIPIEPEAYRVYESVLRRFADLKPDRRPLVILSNTRSLSQMGCFPSGTAIENEWKPVMDNFRRRSADNHRLDEQKLLLEVPFELVRWGEIMSGEDFGDASKNFMTRWPKAGGFYDFSAVGFDPAQTRAIVYLGRRTLSVGEGQYHFLEKVADWTEVTLRGVNVCKGQPFY